MSALSPVSLLICIALLTACAGADEASLQWGTFLGGTGYYEEGSKCAHDADGNVVIVGHTSSPNLPVTAGAFDTSLDGWMDAFVAKLSADGSQLLWCTYLGGSEHDRGIAVAVDPEGNIVVAGATGSADFPTTPGAFDEEYHAGDDAFVAKLSSSGDELLWSTYLGGYADEWAEAVALHADGEVVVAGWTSSSGFPTTPGAFDETFAGGMYPGATDGFVCKLDAAGATLVWGTFLGGDEALGFNGEDRITSLLLDAAGHPIVAGSTDSPEFPTTAGAFDPTFSDSEDGFITKLSRDGSALVWSSYFGGSLGDNCSDLAWSDDGHLLVCGETCSTNLPTAPGTYQPVFGGGRDGYAAKIDIAGSTVRWCSYLGTSGAEAANAIARDAGGTIVVTGRTNSTSFPVTPDAFDPTYNGGWDNFLACLDSEGRQLVWGSYLGGTDRDEVRDLATYGNGVVVLGHTLGSDYPVTPGAFDETHNGGYDVCASRITLLDFAAVAGSATLPDAAAVLGLPEPIPFVDQVVIHCGRMRPEPGAITVHDLDGRLVCSTLPIVRSGPSGYQAVWDGRTDDGRQVGNGVYFVTLDAATGPQCRRVLRLR